MNTLFFPHTAIAPDLATALHAALGPTTLLHPLPEAVTDRTAALADARQVELVFPFQGDGDTLMAAMAAFRDWAVEHAGNDLSGLVGRGAPIPFYGADATSRIVAEIKAGRGEPAENERKARLQRARLLLLLAEDFETRHSELADDLSAFEADERQMLEELKGDDDALPGAAGPSSTTAPAPVMHMLAARVAAWAQLALAATDLWTADPPALFLTDCREVLDYITDQTAAETLLDRHPVSSSSDGLRAWLAAPQGPPPAAESSVTPAIRLTLVRLTGREVFGWLRGLAGVGSGGATDPDSGPSANAVLLGMIAQA